MHFKRILILFVLSVLNFSLASDFLSLPELIKNKRAETAYALILKNKDKIDFNAVDDEGSNAFHHIVLLNNTILIDELFRNNCDLNLVNKKGETPLYLALTKENVSEKTVLDLIAKGAVLYAASQNVNLKDYVLVYKRLYNQIKNEFLIEILMRWELKWESNSPFKNLLMSFSNKTIEQVNMRLKVDFKLEDFLAFIKDLIVDKKISEDEIINKLS